MMRMLPARGASEPASAPSDGDVAKRVLDGDTGAFRLLVEPYQLRVHRIILRLVGNRDDAAELTQQAFLAAYAALARYNQAYPFSSWIVRIGVNLAKDHLKSARQREIASQPADFELQRDTGDDPELRAVTRERSVQLAAALQTLTVSDREILILKDIEELSYGEIRAILGRPITALKIRALRARRRLREALERASRSVT